MVIRSLEDRGSGVEELRPVVSILVEGSELSSLVVSLKLILKVGA